jgi:hypothetical protein
MSPDSVSAFAPGGSTAGAGPEAEVQHTGVSARDTGSPATGASSGDTGPQLTGVPAADPAPQRGSGDEHDASPQPRRRGMLGADYQRATQHAAVTPHSCTNCGAPVPGRFCGQCGQRLEHSVHSVWHFTREATEDLTHADSRLWATLWALLFKPGFLTREFLDGRRARYLPPLRLYLVLSVIFFFIAASSHHQTSVVTFDDNPDGHKTVNVTHPKDISEVPELQAKAGETPEQRVERICGDIHYNGPAPSFVLPFISASCRKVMKDNGHELGQAFLHNLPRAIFILLPLVALVMKLLYWRPRRYYVEHLLFFVHNHAFLFLLFGVVWPLENLASNRVTHWISDITTFYVVYYLFVAMRRVYGQSRWRTSAKFVVLGFAYMSGATFVLALTTLYSMLTL